MVKRLCVCVCLLILGGVWSAAQESATGKYAGVWSGTWEGVGSSGGFELTLEQTKDGVLGGRVSVTGEPTYKATLKTLSIEGTKLTATYDFPPDEQVQINLAATFDGDAADGTWAARTKSDGNEVASGTWKVKKK